jgi:hypothetical protein
MTDVAVSNAQLSRQNARLTHRQLLAFLLAFSSFSVSYHGHGHGHFLRAHVAFSQLPQTVTVIPVDPLAAASVHTLLFPATNFFLYLIVGKKNGQAETVH